MIPRSLLQSRLGSVAERARHQSDVASLREPCFALVTRLHGLPPHIHYNSLMLAAAVTSQALGLDPHEELARALRKVDHAEGPHTIQIQAVRDYVEGELAHKDQL